MSDPPHGRLSADAPEQLGNYRILDVLGEGAMGVVYEAEEVGLVRRRVAVKVIRAGVSDQEVLARFEAERQTLALMDHPGIARVLDAGVTANGQPFFAMELARGLPITEYCDSRRLSITQRLELFISVCQAMQHAHQKGVIHRDMKPSNVLVTDQDDRAQPKIIDFGIAKALGPQLGMAVLRTRWGQAVGTPAYMSPEQAETAGVDVDTRADIYSMGVLLYEILVGRLPMDPGEIGMQAFFMHLKLRDTTPPAPSSRLRTLGADGDAIAAARRVNPSGLRSELRGDIDWIVMKAMEPDRVRRYATANALAMDLQRYLTHQPIVARPPSTMYRVRMFTRRHRVGVIAVAVAIVGLGLGTTLSVLAWRRAEREAAASREVTKFLVDLFNRSAPDEVLGTFPTTRELLDRSVQRIRTDLAGEPALQARLMFTMGDVYRRLGLYPSADSLLRDAVRIRERLFGPNDSSVASALTLLGVVERDVGDLSSAERDQRRALGIEQLHFGLESPMVSPILAELGALASLQQRSAEAESLYVRALEIDEHAAVKDQKFIARDLMGLGVVHYRLGHLEQAEPYYRRALDTQIASLGADHPHVAATENALGALYYGMGRYKDALPLYQAALVFYERTLTPDHPYIGFVLANLGEANWRLGRYDEAERLFRRSLRIEEAKLPPYNGEIGVPLNGLAGVLRDSRRYDEAERLYQRALDLRIRAYGLKSPEVEETRKDYDELQRRRSKGNSASR